MKIIVDFNIDKKAGEKGEDIHHQQIRYIPESEKDKQILKEWKENSFHREIWMNNDGIVTVLNYCEYNREENDQ